MAVEEAKTFQIEGARIIFRNFSGKESQYNDEGTRNFSVILDPDMAEQLLKDGWNVKYLKSRDDDVELGDPYLPIAVNFKNRPPTVVMIAGTSRTRLTEDTVSVLDWADISNVDLIARGFDWTVNGKGGTKAYLKTLFVTIEEDDLERKYKVHDVEQ